MKNGKTDGVGSAKAAGLLAALLVALAGCTSRAVTVTSLPPGAEVSINRRVVGKTPVRVNYTHYGTYRVELRQDRYKTLVREERLRPPWYGYDPFAFFADNVMPARANDESYLHYVMDPVDEKSDRDGLMRRATAARDGKVTHPITQESMEVAWAPLPVKPGQKEPTSPGEPPAATVEVPAVAEPVTTTRPELPSELKAPKGITEKPPEATPTAAKPTKPAETTEAMEPKKPEAAAVKRPRRTPQGEILIYDEPTIEDPGKKK